MDTFRDPETGQTMMWTPQGVRPVTQADIDADTQQQQQSLQSQISQQQGMFTKANGYLAWTPEQLQQWDAAPTASAKNALATKFQQDAGWGYDTQAAKDIYDTSGLTLNEGAALGSQNLGDYSTYDPGGEAGNADPHYRGLTAAEVAARSAHQDATSTFNLRGTTVGADGQRYFNSQREPTPQEYSSDLNEFLQSGAQGTVGGAVMIGAGAGLSALTGGGAIGGTTGSSTLTGGIGTDTLAGTTAGETGAFDTGASQGVFDSAGNPLYSTTGGVGTGEAGTGAAGAAAAANSASNSGSSTASTSGSSSAIPADQTGAFDMYGSNSGAPGGQPGTVFDYQSPASTYLQQAQDYAKQLGITPASALSMLLKAAGRAAPAALGAIGANQQANSLGALADKYMNLGAPSRARYEASFAPGFTMANDPGYMDALDQSSKATLHGLSMQGNPAGSPNAWSQSLADNYQKTAYPALQNFRNTNANAGGIASLQTAAPAAATGAIGAQSNVFNALGAGANDIFNPPKSLAQQLADYQRLMKQGSGAVV